MHRVLGAVHGQRRRKHQHEDDEGRGDDLISLLVEDRADHVEGIVVSVDPEQMEDAHDAQHAEGDKAAQEEEGQNRQKVDQPVKGAHEPEYRAAPREARIEEIRRPDAQGVLDDKDEHRHDLDDIEHAGIRLHAVEGAEKQSRDIQNDDARDEHVEKTRDPVARVADLYDFENAVPQAFVAVLFRLRHGSSPPDLYRNSCFLQCRLNARKMQKGSLFA